MKTEKTYDYAAVVKDFITGRIAIVLYGSSQVKVQEAAEEWVEHAHNANDKNADGVWVKFITCVIETPLFGPIKIVE